MKLQTPSPSQVASVSGRTKFIIRKNTAHQIWIDPAAHNDGAPNVPSNWRDVLPLDDNDIWDPCGEKAKEENLNHRDDIQVTNYLYSTIITASSGMMEGVVDQESITEIDLHANMPVMGRHAYVLYKTKRTADVSDYFRDYSPKQVKIVDAAMQYNFLFTDVMYVLVIKNALYVISMKTTWCRLS